MHSSVFPVCPFIMDGVLLRTTSSEHCSDAVKCIILLVQSSSYKTLVTLCSSRFICGLYHQRFRNRWFFFNYFTKILIILLGKLLIRRGFAIKDQKSHRWSGVLVWSRPQKDTSADTSLFTPRVQYLTSHEITFPPCETRSPPRRLDWRQRANQKLNCRFN